MQLSVESINRQRHVGRTREIARPFAKLFSAAARATFNYFIRALSTSSLYPQLEKYLQAEYGQNYSKCRNARAELPAYQYVYIPQLK